MRGWGGQPVGGCKARPLRSGDLDVEGGADVRVQPDRYLVRTHRLDRAADLDGAAVGLGARRGPHRGGEVGRGPGAEQPAGFARLGLQPRGQPGELRGHVFGVAEAADLTRGPGPLDQVDLLLGATRPAHRETARNQVVTPVPPGDLDDVTSRSETGDLLGQDELHGCATHRQLPPQRSVLVYGSRAISRAFLIAEATSRWCCVQLPVTRRARILPRSEMNFRNSPMSL